MAGRLIAKSISGSVDIKNITKGVYVAKCGDKTLKIVR